MSKSQRQRACEDACRDAPWSQVADAVREARGGAWEDGRNLCAAVRGAARYEGRLAGFDQHRHGGGAYRMRDITTRLDAIERFLQRGIDERRLGRFFERLWQNDQVVIDASRAVASLQDNRTFQTRAAEATEPLSEKRSPGSMP